MPAFATVLIAATLSQLPSGSPQQAPAEVLELVAVQGPNLHARGAVDVAPDGMRSMWWWHFFQRTPEQPDWDGSAYRVEVDCERRTTRTTRAEFFDSMQYRYGEPAIRPAIASEPGSVRERLIQAACENFTDGDPFSSPAEAYALSQEYFRRLAED